MRFRRTRHRPPEDNLANTEGDDKNGSPTQDNDAANSQVRVARSYSDIRQILCDSESFTIEGDVLDCGQTRPLLPLQASSEAHPPLRARLEEFFSSASVGRTEVQLRSRAIALIEPAVTARQADFNEFVARPFPVAALLDVLDLPAEHAQTIRRFHDGILRPAESDGLRERDAVSGEVYDFFGRAVACAEPESDGLISFLKAEGESGQALADSEVVDVCYLLLLAGIDPVANALASLTSFLAADSQRQVLLTRDAAALRRTIEEILRWGSPVHILTREATSDVRVGDEHFGRRERVGCDLTAGNRDPSVFDNPALFDPDRRDASHLSFGAGPHRCVGMHLARLQMRIVIEEMRRLAPGFSLALPSDIHITADGITANDELQLRFTS